VHRLGAPATIGIGLLLAAAATLAFPVTTDLAIWLSLRAVVGLATALIYAPGITYVLRLLPPERGTSGVGLYFAGLSVGVTIVFLVTPGLEEALGWRWPFYIFGGAILAFGLAFAVLAWPTKRLGRSSADGHPRNGVGRLARNGPFLAVCGALLVAMFVAYGVYTWIAPWLDEVGGFSASQVSAALGLALAIGIPATLLAGWLTDRSGRPMVIAGAFFIPATALIVLAIGDQVSYSVAVLVAVIASFGVTGGLSPLFVLPRIVVSDDLVGMATGVATTAAIIGAILSTYLGGLLIEVTDGYSVTMTVYAVSTVAAVFVLFPLAAARIRRGNGRLSLKT
jgi:predicted MFS family arabinose efflux permease